MAATNPTDAGIDHLTVVPADHAPETTGDIDVSAEEGAPRCPACGRPFEDH